MRIVFILVIYLLYIFLKNKKEPFIDGLPSAVIKELLSLKPTIFKHDSSEKKCLPIQGNVGMIINRAIDMGN